LAEINVTMKKNHSLAGVVAALLLAPAFLFGQQTQDPALNSITADELRNHIFFLASDYLNGRQSVSAGYEIASQYVATQFAAAGLVPAVSPDSAKGYFQQVPFAKRVFSEKVNWTLTVNGTEQELEHLKDFKVLMASQLNMDKQPLVFVGYGIEEPDAKWDDLKGLDLEGKIAVCLTGVPLKKGKPVLPEKINSRYSGDRGTYTKLFSGLGRKGVAAIILVTDEESTTMKFSVARENFSTEKTVYMGGKGERDRSGGFPQVFVVKPEFLDKILPAGADRQKPADLKGVTLTSANKLISDEPVYSNNVIGIVPGTDPVLKNEYIVVGAHLDHVAPQQGKPSNGADDNASGSAGVIEIAGAMAQNPGKRTVVFITYTAEEMGLLGSSYFLESGLFPQDKIRFNINLDMIGRTGKGNEDTRAHYVVTDKKYLAAITSFIKELNTGITDFPILFDDDEHSPGGSDHMTFIGKGIPAFFFFSGVHPDLHRPGDDPDKIDYPKAAAISRLGYLIANKLANMEVVPSFE
jgi:hypothetical protein